MIKGIIVIMTLFTLFQYPYDIESGSFKEDNINVVSPKEISKIEELLNNSDGILDGNEKNMLTEIENKIKNYQVLVQEELDFIRECELKVISTKLGPEKFEEYCNLIKKRDGKEEFDQDKRFRLLELERELNGIK